MYQFQKNARVCFFGDSITRGGIWIRRMYDYYLNTLHIPCEMYNCGVSGDNAGNAITHMEASVFFYEPTDVVIAFGMNDLGYDLYDGREATEELIRERRGRCDRYLENVRSIAQELQKRKIRMIFCTPTPIDELTDSETPTYYGASASLREMGERLKVLSKEFGGNVVDFHSYYANMLKIAYKEGKVINREDRIHPNEIGAVMLSEIFLHEQGYDVKVSQSYQELENDAHKVFSEEENKRFFLEQSKQPIEFVRWLVFSGITDEDRIEKEIKEKLKTETNEFIINCYNEYLTHSIDLRERQEELKRYTKTTFHKDRANHD